MDRALADRYTEDYTKQVWWLVASFLFLVGITHYGSIVLIKVFPGKRIPADVEADGRVVRHASSFRRLPLATANAYRVVAFRTTFTVGPISLNLAEVALTIIYIIALFVWSFINSTHHDTPLIHGLTILGSHIPRWDKVRACILYKPCCEHCLQSAPTRCRPWNQK